jgi:hypothetical protein
MKFLRSEVTHGCFGFTFAVAGITFAQRVETGLRLLSLTLTILVATATLISTAPKAIETVRGWLKRRSR